MPDDGFTVEWLAPVAETVDLYYTTDRQPNADAETNTLIEAGLDAATGVYEWTIPDTPSPSVRLLLKDSDHPGEFDFSDRFRIRPYIMVRIKPDSTYDPFKPSFHGWGYVNETRRVPASEAFWNKPYVEQYHTYADHQDPYSGLPYAADTNLYAQQVFVSEVLTGSGGEQMKVLTGTHGATHPEWTSMVRAFGTGDTYRVLDHGQSVSYDRVAALAWKQYATRGFGGVCYGLSVSAGLMFADRDRFGAAFPSIGPRVALFAFRPDLQVELDVIRDVNTLLTRQFDKRKMCFADNIVSKLKTMFLSDDRDGDYELSIDGSNGAHALTPYRLEEDDESPDRYRVYVYDSNHPGDDERFVEIDESTGGTFYAGWGPVTVTLNGPMNVHYAEGDLEFKLLYPDAPCGRVPGKAGEWIRVLTGRDSTAVTSIRSRDGQIGWQGDSLYQTLEMAKADFFVGGLPGPPFGYHLLKDTYRIEQSVGDDSLASVAFIYDGKFLDVDRIGAVPLETDYLAFDPNSGVTVQNGGPSIRTLTFTAVMQPSEGIERVMVVDSLSVPPSDSVRVDVDGVESGDERFEIQNFGEATRYNLSVRLVDQGNVSVFKHVDLSLPAHTTHIVEPHWDVLMDSDMTVYVDLGSDGIFDDTLAVENLNPIAVSFEDEWGLRETSAQTDLGAPYPNPFRETVTIPFTVASTSVVNLAIYDVLGREVSQLLSDLVSPGNHEVIFNGSNLTSGIYFVRLENDGLITTRAVTFVR